MFTGIIEEVGTIATISKARDAYRLNIQAKQVLEGVQLGDSIAVNGICLTVTSFSSTQFSVDVMPETLRATSLRSLASGSRVNLERAMSMERRFGGHFVSGHVDGTGIIRQRKAIANAVYYEIEADPALLKYIMPKGSITIDGISLTVVEVGQQQFSVSIIPHTLQETILADKYSGDVVNLEADMLAKYMERLLEHRFQGATPEHPQATERGQKGLTLEKLIENGYMS